MFEGLVSQLLVGYLGRYVKDIQKEKLKITLWNEEVLLENVELILEAFDYLQLPFGLKEGRVGRLSIKIPWKKLGWDPIIITLEDVYISASQRDDNEWSLEAVERREFSGKKAKLAAAELAKLSRHVCDNHAGQSFISFITTKVLDSIQVSIRNFHILYYDTMASSGQIKFGLKFSSLAILKQPPVGSSGGWVRGSHAHKVVEILGLEVYCSTFQESGEMTTDSSWNSKLWNNESSQSIHHDSILAPCDVSLSLSVSKIGKLDNNAPQYSINAELTNLAISLDEVQLRHILVLWDCLYICRLRDKYGPFRPWCCPLSKKREGWQTLWWHYAQKSVLSDVRKKLKKTSWRYLGQRITYRRRYITLYKSKLELLRQDQSVHDRILEELELMEKESDIDDILSYRSIAESQIQYLFNSTTSTMGGARLMSVEKSRIDERVAGKTRGWLNWLSRGMLGAGGTDDSSQFSGVVSDEVIKDICEATKFHPMVSSNEVAAEGAKICLCAVKFDIHHVSAKLWSRKHFQVMEMIFTRTTIDFRFGEESGSVNFLINSAEIINPSNQNVILLIRKPIIENDIPEGGSCSFQVVLSQNCEVDLSVKVILEPLEFSHDEEFLLHIMEFFVALKSYKLQQERVLSSMNGIENDNARLLSKAEYILSSHKKVTWDVSITNISINAPWRNAASLHCSMVMLLETVHFTSKSIFDVLSPTVKEQYFVPKYIDNVVSFDIPLAFQLQDLYDQFEIKIDDFEVAMMVPFHSKKVSILEKFSASITVGVCLIPDELLLKQFEVFVLVPSICAHISPSLYVAVMELIENSFSKTKNENFTVKAPDNLVSAFSIGVTLHSVTLRLDLENDGMNSSALMLALEEFEMRYTHSELQVCSISTKTVTITVHPPNSEGDFCILYSCCNEHQDDINDKSDSCNGEMPMIKKLCFLLLFESHNINVDPYQCTLYFSNADIHCYPYVIGLLVGFCDSLSSKSTSWNFDNSKPPTFIGFQKFGFSNFFEASSTDCEDIPCSRFPFVTIINSGFLRHLESSLIYTEVDWRKQLNVRDRKISSSKSGIKKGPNIDVGQCGLKSSMKADSASEISSDSVCCFINFNIYGMKVHFHDSSCIVGSLTLPTCKSSMFINKDYMDLLWSLEGLILTSSWCTENSGEILWGPSVPSLSPILNVRVRKESTGPSSSQIEVSIGIQHVYCILPPEYLSIIIGYFTLPDWTPSNERLVDRKLIYYDLEKRTTVAYKFEILDSILILPVEKNELQFLKFELRQLYCSFFTASSLNDALREISSEYLISTYKIGDLNNCFNIFGRDLCLSFLLYKDDRFGCLMFDQGADCQDTILIASLSADIWVRIPCEQESTLSTTSIMAKIENCEVIADDFSVVHGFEAVVNSINQFSLVEEHSKCFKSDVLQFLHLKRSLSASSAASSIVSGTIFTEVRCCVDMLVIKARQSREEELIYKAVLQLTCSALLKEDDILSVNSSFSSLLLYSLPSSIALVQCTSTSIMAPAKISLRRSNEGKYELSVGAPSVDVWLHLSEWSSAINLLNFYAASLSKISMDKSLKNLAVESTDPLKDTSYSSSYLAPVDNLPVSLALVVRSEDIGITFHIPFSLKEEYRELQTNEIEEKSNPTTSSNIVEGSYFSFIVVTVHSKNIEVFVNEKTVRLKFEMDKFSSVVLINKDASTQSWPFFKILKTSSDAEIIINPMNLKVEILCDRVDVCLPHHIFRFWRDFQFQIPETESSELIFCGIELEIKIRKISFLLSDGRWSNCGSLLDILMENVLLHANVLGNNMKGFMSSDFQFNYNNIQKAFWESFVEPWHFEINVTRKLENSTLLNSSIVNDISLRSSAQLNLNLTESLIECLFRTTEMIKDACGIIESQKMLNSPISDITSSGRHAPYILQNLTSLPLLYHVHQGLLNLDEFDLSEFKGEYVQPGVYVPIYVNESVEELFFRHRSSYSSGCLIEPRTNGVGHHFISIQLDGMSVPSSPISMDLVGQTYFEVNFSKPSSEELDMPGNALRTINVNKEHRTNIFRGFTVPVVFDVSVHRYSKLIRLYSTVILFNTTSMPLELRFDIPLSFSPKILDPLCPGEELPLPLHLAEAGRIRFRPMGNSYLWSEAYNLSNLLSHESKIGLRSIVCYPSNRTSDPFRCCISVRNIILPLFAQKMNFKGDLKQSAVDHRHDMHNLVESKKQFIHQVTLSTPLIVKNYLLKEIKLTVDTGGVAHMKILSEVETFFHHVDPSHDLVLELHMEGFKPSSLKFPRAETFFPMANFVGTKFSLSETISLNSDSSNDSLYITMEKTMDAYSGARELGIFVLFLLYNCTGISFFISESTGELNGAWFRVPSSYGISEQPIIGKRDGLSILSSNDPHAKAQDNQSVFSGKNEISARENVKSHSGRAIMKSLILTSSLANNCEKPNRKVSECQKTSRHSSNPNLQIYDKDCKSVAFDHGKVKPCMYSPKFISSATEVMVRACNSTNEYGKQKMISSSWSSPFYLIPPSGSTTVLVPQSTPNAAYVISVTSVESFAGRTNAVTFQPRFVISNACSRDLCYKQKGTEVVFHLSRGEHSHLQWTDTIRELFVSVCYNEPGWQWSGSFLPDHLGDTQIKTRNYVTGALNIIRVEVQNADVSIEDEKIVGSLNGNSATNLILLSDDDTGYMPYRIDNFSKERLRIYQQSCESFETIVHSYTSCPYAWDEPYCPHRLNVEVPGERALGFFSLDDVKEYMSVHLLSTGEKPERILHLSVHAEGATKVLSIIDSSYHTLNNMTDPIVSHYTEKEKHGQKSEKIVDYKDKVSIYIPFIGVSLINSYPEELVFVCARNITVNLLQSLDRQKFSLQILSLQIDNQLRDTPYPVILCFDHKNKNDLGDIMKSNSTTRSEKILQLAYDRTCEPVFCLTVSKWRKTDISLISFEHINLRLGDFHVEIEQQVILRLFEFFKNVTTRLQNKMSPFSDQFLFPLFYDTTNGIAYDYFGTSEERVHILEVPTFNEFHKNSLLPPSIVPVGAPWQQIYLLARRQKKVYVELFDLAPIRVTLSFSSAPWTLHNRVLTSGELFVHRGLMALGDVEGARIHLKQLSISHHMASWESVQEILFRHYTRQLLHEMYKVFGSAGVIGNPMGFARSLGVGIRDFVSVPAKSIFQSPTGFFTGMAQGTSSLLSNTVYAISDAATQFSKSAQKGIVAFTFDDHAVTRVGKQQIGASTHSEGVINEVLEGLTGLLQSPIRGAEKHGLPGVLSGIALGITGLVAKPAASILQVTGKTAQSIRNRTTLYKTGQHRYRTRLPRPLSRELPLRPFTWEEAVGASVLLDSSDGFKLKDEVLVVCKSLKQAGKFVIITETLILVVSCSSLVDLGKPEFQGIGSDFKWVVDTEIGLESVIHVDTDDGIVHIVGSCSDILSKQNQNQPKGTGAMRTARWNGPNPLPLYQTNLEFTCKEEAEFLLRVLLSTIESTKQRGWGGGYILHQHSIR